MNYFYPEMIPEPDYSDSGDEAGSEDEDKRRRFAPDPRPALERLRDLTEVYVSNVNAKSSPSQQVYPAESASKTAPKQMPKTDAKDVSPRATKYPPRPPVKKQPPTAVAKKAKSPERAPKDAAKSPTKSAAGDTTRQVAAFPSQTKARSPPAATSVKTAGRKTSPKPPASRKAAPQGKKTAGAGDARIRGGRSDQDLTDQTSSTGKSSSTEQSSDEDQLIKPKKPYMASSEKQKLHKELKFSQKYSKLVPSKTELQLAIERYTENKVKRELDAEEKSSLEKILEYQAKKIEMQEIMDKCPTWMERLQKPPSTWPDPKTEEFYRVHARVVSSNILTHCFLPEDEDGSQRECSSLPCKSSSHYDSDS